MVRGSYEEAERCEASHLSALSVRELEYKLGAYPYRVMLSFPDGIDREYVSVDGYSAGSGVNHANDKDKRSGKKYKGFGQNG